jgi:hypothetical protein
VSITTIPAPTRSDGRTTGSPSTLSVVPATAAEQLSLPYEYDVTPGIPAVPPVPPALHLVGEEIVDPDPADLPDPRIWAAKLARAISEVASGERPPGQLTRWVARDELARITRRGQAVQRHPSARAQRGVSRLRTVRAVRACPVAPGIVETSAVIVGGDRAHAIAIRFEAVAGRWLATVVELG